MKILDHISAQFPAMLTALAGLCALAARDGLCADINSVAATNAVSYAPAVLPGKGLAQHPFLYTGEADSRKPEQTLYVVRDGKVAWTYSVPSYDTNRVMEELGDATLLSSGNSVFCSKVRRSCWQSNFPNTTRT